MIDAAHRVEFLIQYDYTGGTIHDPVTFWNTNHRVFPTFDAARAAFDEFVDSTEATAMSTISRGRDPAVRGRYRIISRRTSITEVELHTRVAPRAEGRE